MGMAEAVNMVLRASTEGRGTASFAGWWFQTVDVEGAVDTAATEWGWAAEECIALGRGRRYPPRPGPDEVVEKHRTHHERDATVTT
jgi:hypothetical protein